MTLEPRRNIQTRTEINFEQKCPLNSVMVHESWSLRPQSRKTSLSLEGLKYSNIGIGIGNQIAFSLYRYV